MNSLRCVTIALAAITLSSATVLKPSASGDNFELLILHNNDMHARFEQTSQLSGACTTDDREAGKCYGGFPRVAHVVKEARKAAQSGEGPPVLYLNAGDTYTGTAWFTIYKWKIAAEFINALQPDAVSLGNHEFDNGVSGLTPFIENLTCPVLSANLVLNKVPELAREENLKKYIVLDVANNKIGIVGYLTPETKTMAVQNDVEYIDEIDALKEVVKNLQHQGIKIIIALGHSGYTRDLQIAKEVEGLDLVIGGHTNTFLWNGSTPDSEDSQGSYPTYVTQASGRRVPVVQAYAYTKYLGKLHLTFDTNGELISADGTPLLLDYRIPQDPHVLNIIEKYRKDVLVTTQEVLGNTSVILDAKTCSIKECNLGNLITDAVIFHYAVNYKGEHWTDAPIAIIQGGGIRSSVAHAKMPMKITKGDLLAVLPFEGDLVAVTINGTILLKVFENSVSKYSTLDMSGQFLQVSGIKVTYNLNKPVGSRVVMIETRCWACNIPAYSKIEDKQFYKVIMSSFLYNGGDGFGMLKNLPKQTLDYNELLSTQYYVSRHSPIYPQVEGRITFIEQEYTTASSPIIKLSLSAACLGNHEFDEAVSGVIPFIQNLNSPVLAANLILDKVPELRKESNLHSSIVLLINGTKIGIIGYLTPETKYLAPRNDVEYEDEVIAIRREVKKLKSQGVKILIALGHSGFLKDIEIAKQVEDIDLVIGGHSNTFLWNSNTTMEIPEIPQGPYPTTITHPSGRKVRVVQAYAYTKYLGKLHMIFDTDGEILKCNGEPILLNQKIPRDPELLTIVSKYQSSVGRINSEVLGTSLVTLNGEQCRLRECNMGNLITTAMLNYTKEYHSDEYPNVNIAIVQGGRIRASIDHGKEPFNITRGDLITVLPFSDTLTIVHMNGSVLKQSLEHSIATWRTIDSTGQFLQFDGMEVIYDLSKPPGSRLVKAKAVCSNCGQSKPVDVKDYYEYEVMMPTFLAENGDGYMMFDGLHREILTYNEVECVMDYLKKYTPINPKLSGRIVIFNEDKVEKPEVMTEVSKSEYSSSSALIGDKTMKLYYLIFICIVYGLA